LNPIFFLNGDLHKKLEVNRGRDLLRAWNYPKGEVRTYNYTDTLRFMEPAFTTPQVAAMFGRNRITIERAIWNGNIEVPQHQYTLTEDRRLIKYMWSEDDILGLLDYFASVHRGRPRQDGRQTASADLPTPREVRAMIRHDGQTLGINDGVFVPTWKANK